MLGPLVLMISVSIGAAIGWTCGSPLGLLGAYLTSVLGASIGLFIGRKIQRNLSGD